MKTHVVQVVYTPVRGGEGSELIALRLADRESVSHYLPSEAPSAAVCLALQAAAGRVARYEVHSGDGFTVKVEFVNEAGEPLTPREPELGDAAFAEMEAVADADDG